MAKELLLIIFCLTLVCSFIIGQRRKVTIPEALITCLFLLFIVIIRPPTLSDYHAYVNLYYHGAERMEPSFTFFSESLKSLGLDYIALFAVYGLLSVGLKTFAIRLLSPFFYLSILIWLSNTFFYHDLIQIRASVACGCLLWMIYWKIRDRRSLMILFFISACLFHYSSIIAGFLFFISKDKDYAPLYITLIPVSYIFFFAGISISSLVPLFGLDSLTNLYKAYSASDSEANVFNLVQMTRCLICLILWSRVKTLKKLSPYFLTLLKVFTIGCAMIGFFGEFIRVSFRLAELLWSVESILFPFLAYIFYPKVKTIKVIPIALGIVLFLLMFNNSHWETGSFIV